MLKQYALGCAFSCKELFENFPFKKLKTNCAKCKEIIGNAHRDMLATKIFTECVQLVLNDVIDNNATF
jgi:hypothetical protein